MRLSWLRDASWLDGRRAVAYSVICVCVFAVVTVVWVLGGDGLADPRGVPLGGDFVSFWAASKLAGSGAPAAVYDPTRHFDVELSIVGTDHFGWYSFFYPPTFLAVVLPLALLPYVWSLLCWVAVTLAGYALLMRRIVTKKALWPVLAFPAAYINMAHGQNGFLTVILMGSGLMLLERYPLLAGIPIGLLSYKPHFGLLIPLCLLVTGRWKTIATAALTVAAFALWSRILFGVETWQAYIDALPLARSLFEEGYTGWEKVPSIFALVTTFGGSAGAAYGAQLVVATMAACTVLWVWRATESFELKASALVVGTFLVTPYAYDYDLVLLALPLAWLAAIGIRDGFLPWEKMLLMAVWLMPLLMGAMATYLDVPLAQPLIVLLLVAIARRAAARRAPLTRDVGLSRVEVPNAG
jgi:hypothetical protein